MSTQISLGLLVQFQGTNVEASLQNDALNIHLNDVSLGSLISWLPDSFSDCGFAFKEESLTEDLDVAIYQDLVKICLCGKDNKTQASDLVLILAKQENGGNNGKFAGLSVGSEESLDISQVAMLSSFLPKGSVLLSRIVVAYGLNNLNFSGIQTHLPQGFLDTCGSPKTAGNGAMMGATFTIDGQTIHLHTATEEQKNNSPVSFIALSDSQTEPSAEANQTSDQPIDPNTAPVKWVSFQRAVGPIHINRIGGRWLGGQDGALQGLLDAGLSTSAFAISFSGLSIAIPVFKYDQISQYRLGLSGLDVSFSSPAVSIEGSLAYSREGDHEYSFGGSLSVRGTSFCLIASAEFKKYSDCYSLFAFAKLQRALGGPPAFKVTALSVGFGYNQAINAPSIDQVQSFPLLTISSDNLQNAYKDISNITRVSQGEYWIAAGIEFSSFEHIQSNVIAILEVGKEFEVLILGQSHGSFPANSAEKPYGYVELDIEVVIEPAKGLFKAEASLSSNSYVIDQDCHLTGGFAFYSWFGSNQNSGDFVFTVGGYGPSFAPPAHYPVVPRLGFNWNVSEHVQIKGGAYLAITPSCVMAGGSLEIVYQDGNLRAWLTAYADLIICWKPFHFIADIGITIGISYAVHFWFINTTLRFELGATLNLYGPPTGGVIHIHLWVISFSVAFGAQQSQMSSVGFNEFLQLISKGSGTPDICTISITAGLIREVADHDSNTKIWIIRAGAAAFDITSGIPISTLTLNNSSVETNQPTYRVIPMNSNVGASNCTISISSKNGPDSDPISTFNYTLYQRKLPGALWGAAIPDSQAGSNASPNASATLFESTVGLQGIRPVSNDVPSIICLQAETVFTPTPIATYPIPILVTAAEAEAESPAYLYSEFGVKLYSQDKELQAQTRALLEMMGSADQLKRDTASLGGGSNGR